MSDDAHGQGTAEFTRQLSGCASAIGDPVLGDPAGRLRVGLAPRGRRGRADRIGTSSSDEAGAKPTPSTAAPSPTSSIPPPLVIPGDCVKVAQDSHALLDLAEQAAEAARDLDADQLSTLVAEIKAQQEQIQAQAVACSAAAAADPSASASP